MQFKHVAAAGAFVQPIDVLGGERELRIVRRDVREREMPGVRLHTQGETPPMGIPAPDQLRVALPAARLAKSWTEYWL